jgi:hypothetical protein
MTHPYLGAKDYRFWRKAVSEVEHHRLDPVVETRFQLEPNDRFSTAGSCFAQHISKRLSKLNFNYFIPEDGSHLGGEERAARGFGMFSARFGNIYTVRQLLFLLLESLGRRSVGEDAWVRKDGRYIDPYRPNIEPDGFSTAAQVKEARAEHLEFVRRMFLESDIFIFTLGLTESWMSRTTGDVFPLAPGVAGGRYSADHYEFVNFTVDDVRSDLHEFLSVLKAENPGVRVLLTVSPVPLIATAEDRHVLVSTTYSKSVLRIAAEDARNNFPWVEYFPSFEIITGNFNGGRYYEDDLREVNEAGVDHAMRCFVAHYVNGVAETSAETRTEENEIFAKKMAAVVCDEEAIAALSF